LLPIQKNHFTYLQQYDENHCIYLARIARHNEKAGGNATAHAQHIIIYFLPISIYPLW